MDRTELVAKLLELQDTTCNLDVGRPCTECWPDDPASWCLGCQTYLVKKHLEAVDAEATDWHLVADGVKHHPDCVNNAATGGSVLTCYRCQAEKLTEAMRVIYKGLREDEKGEFWTVDKWLKAQGVYTDNLQGHRMLIEAAKIALKSEG